MAFCSKCGAQVKDGASFCQACGNKINSAQPQGQPIYGSSEQQNVMRVAPMTRAVQTLKSIGSSPLFLVAVIAFTLAMIFGLFGAFSNTPVNRILDSVYKFARMTDNYDIMYGVNEVVREIDFNSVGIAAVVGKIFSMIPEIIVAIGLWMIFAAASNRMIGTMKTSGITLLKIMNIINLVFACIGYAIAGIVLFVLTIAMASLAEEALVVMLVIIAVCLIGAVLNIIFYVKVNKTLCAAKTVLLTGSPYAYASRYVGVLAFINAFTSFISIFATYGVFGKMAELCAVVATGCFGAMIFVYRKRMRICAMQQTAPRADYVQPTQESESETTTE